MITRTDAYQAACLIRDLRRGHSKPFTSLELDGAIVELVRDVDQTIAVIRATDELQDWWRFNLRVVPGLMSSGGDRYRWHGGFLRYAKLLFGFIKASKPDQIIGHSLGGAAAQIIGPSLGIPAVTIGAPPALWGWQGAIDGEHLVSNWCGTGDFVCQSRMLGLLYRHVGLVNRVPVNGHRIEWYIEAMEVLA